MDNRKIAKNYQDLHPQRKLQESKEKEEGKVIQLIVFYLGDEEFGADINQVREIIRAGTVTSIPDSPDFIKGVTNVRGEIAVVIDLKRHFSLRVKENQEKHIIMTEQEKSLFGLLVDEVSEVLRIPEEDIKATPELVTRIDRAYISGVLTLENRLIIMLDLSKVLSEEGLAKLSEIRLRHRFAIEKAEEKAGGKAATAESPKDRVSAELVVAKKVRKK
ncbi:chemotaxis protein CheW [Patescibacteria group bacterium]|nr:chemotaxis protein CheW [Patescibacteria group bacterium]